MRKVNELQACQSIVRISDNSSTAINLFYCAERLEAFGNPYSLLSVFWLIVQKILYSVIAFEPKHFRSCLTICSVVGVITIAVRAVKIGNLAPNCLAFPKHAGIASSSSSLGISVFANQSL
jgi:hypothetical protein